MPADASFANVSLLLHCDGTVGGTSFPDSSAAARTITATGATTQAGGKFSQGASFNGSAYMRADASNDFNFGAGDFTVETFASFASGAAGGGTYRGIFACENITVIRGWLLLLDGDSANKINFSMFSGSTAYTVLSLAAPATNTLMHIAVARQGTNLRLFVNGVLQSTTSVGTEAINNVSGIPLHVGCLYNTSVAGYHMMGLLDDIRVTKGVARYTADFTPPSAPFPDVGISYDISGTVRDATGALASRKIAAYREDTNALVGTTTSDATTGVYNIETPADTAHTLVFYPALGENLNALVRRGVLPIES